MTPLVVRLLFLVGNIIGNIYILSSHQPFLVGADYDQSLVFFNATMIVIIYIVDFLIVKTQRLRMEIEIGEGLADLHRHER